MPQQGAPPNRRNDDSPNPPADSKPPPYWRISAFSVLLLIDTISSILLLTPILPIVRQYENLTTAKHYTLYGSLLDLSAISVLRIVPSALGLLISYARAQVPPEFPFELYHPNGDKKTREELEQEALEETFGPWFRRYCARLAFLGECFGFLTQVFCVVKCLSRMNFEMGTLQDQEPFHPVFWLVVLLQVLLSAMEAVFLDKVCRLAGQYGKERADDAPAFIRTISSTLNLPLLANQEVLDDSTDEEEQGEVNDEDVRGVSDITGDANYKATWKDLLFVCYPDIHLISIAFVFLLLAAIAQVYIPKFLGNILDALAEAFADADDDSSHRKSMFEVPGFIKNVKLLLAASIAAGVFAGFRGSVFTIVGGRVNVRLRVQLMDALLSQDIGFFDTTKTGDITSRLSSDTTLVGDQVSLNVNVFLRSLVQALGVLIFMFLVSWQLSILAFISVPVITMLSKWYGEYVRSLTKLMQKKLADGNAVSEAALGSMSTVRAFDAAESELKEFEGFMEKYLSLNYRAAVAYLGFAAMVTSLPEIVFAVVMFYGGLLVRNGDLTSGQLVSFLLYLQSLSDAFSTIGWVFSSLTQAVGAADKVFELMNRKPRIRPPTRSHQAVGGQSRVGILGVEAVKTRMQRAAGLHPPTCKGAIEIENVQLYYPARPQRCVLNGLSVKIEPGSIVALVGQSGGGKSSVMSLIQHLYEPSSGTVQLDGIDVHDLSPSWLSQNISIVSQEPTLFARSIRRNIMYGLEGTDKEPTQEEIEEAARLANAHEFIQRMPQKYDTEVGERGVQLSGGQKQRIAIARALVRKPRVLLLDEATSALDAESEHLVQQAIDDMIARGKEDKNDIRMTVIIVAHRLSTVRSADCIFVVKEGQVVEKGRHDELIDNPEGAYASLIKRQLEAQQKLENGK